MASSSNLAENRRAIRHLLDERNPADAMAAYYAFRHPDNRTQLVVEPPGAARANAYLALSRTGMDLFRPLVTMRLRPDAPEESAALIYSALPGGAAVILSAPLAHLPLIKALFDVQAEEVLRLMMLDRGRFEPIINVLVTQAESANGLPRYTIRRGEGGAGGTVMASADVNWQSPHFAEIAVQTHPDHRRQGWGRSVVAALVHDLLKSGRTPLYAAADSNSASIALAESVGFVDLGIREALLEATLNVQRF